MSETIGQGLGCQHKSLFCLFPLKMSTVNSYRPSAEAFCPCLQRQSIQYVRYLLIRTAFHPSKLTFYHQQSFENLKYRSFSEFCTILTFVQRFRKRVCYEDLNVLDNLKDMLDKVKKRKEQNWGSRGRAAQIIPRNRIFIGKSIGSLTKRLGGYLNIVNSFTLGTTLSQWTYSVL